MNSLQVLVPLIAALVPLIITPGLLFHFDITPKLALLLFGVAFLLARYPILSDSVASVWSTRQGRFYIACLGLQLTCFVISTSLSVDPFLSLDGSEWRRLGLYTFTAVLLFAVFSAGSLGAPRSFERLLWACAVITIPIAAYGIAQYFGLDPFLPGEAYHAGEGPYMIVRPPGTLGHADYLASFLVFAVFVSITLLRLPLSRRQKYVPLAASAVATLAILLTGTRGGLAGLAVGLLTFWICSGVKFRRRHVFTGLILLSALAGFVLSPLGAKLRARAHWSAEDPYGGARLLLWRDSVRMIASRPVVGFGPETFIREFPRFQSLQLSRAYPDFFHESPHNIVLDATVSQGIPGGVLLVAGWAVAMWAGILGLRQGHKLAAPLIAANCALMVSHQFIVFVPATALVFFLAQVLLIALVPNLPADSNPKPNGTSNRSWIKALPQVICCVLLAVYATRVLVSDRALDLVRERIANRDISGAVAGHDVVERWQPRGGSAELYYSRAMAAVITLSPSTDTRAVAGKQALDAGTVAVSRSEQRANAWYSLASLFAAQGDAGNVERALRTAVAWAPNWFKPHWALAQLLHLQGRNQEAMAEAVAAVDRNGGKNPEVIATWLTIANQLRQ